jgi:two-component system sensor histidine kinase KdpD
MAGKPRIYLGYAVGVGKTYRMLTEAHELLSKGIDVVSGYVEPHWRETIEKAKGIETIPFLVVPYKNAVFKETDVEAIIKRRPQVVLIDEITHTNPPGSKNLKRYQDVADLLKASIDVNTALNIQHLESLAPEVEQALEIRITERIPDKIAVDADIIPIDIKEMGLISRIKAGKLFESAEGIDTALNNFFRKENLKFLRDLMLRWLKERKK